MKRLLYITNAIDGSGGLERVLSVKTQVLAEDFGYEIHVVTLNQKSKTDLFFPFSEKITQHNLEVSGHPISYLSSYISGIKAIIGTVQPHVILVCDDGLKAFFLPKLLGKKIPIIYERHVSKLIEISEHHGVFKNLMTKFKFKVMDFLARDFTRFVVLTEGSRKEWQLNNLLVIPNPLPFYPKEASTLRNKKVIAVGKQSYQKSYDRLLRSWALLGPSCSDWELHIYGKKDENLGLAALAVDLGIQHQVFFHGPERNIEAKYAESSIFVLSSRYEGFGMVLIEAMSYGLPCVSFNCPYGPSDIIQSHEDGFLVANGDLEGFAKKLQELMDDENLRRAMGEKARENVVHFFPRNVIKMWDELFKTI